MLHYPLRKIAALALLITLGFSFTGIPAYQANYAGTWVLNEGKSELGQMGRAAPGKIVITQTAETITFAKTQPGMDGSPATTTESLSDGKESQTTVFNGNGTKKSTLKWAADGNTFTVKSNISVSANGQSFEVTSNESWALGADGKTMTLTNVVNTPQGEITLKCVYDKQ
jgi:hypothetical protein